jgi:hypothetical protein
MNIKNVQNDINMIFLYNKKHIMSIGSSLGGWEE